MNLYGMVGNDAVGRWDYLGLCLIHIDVGHGGTENSRTTQRMNERTEDPLIGSCSKFIAVGCGANRLNSEYRDAGIGIPEMEGIPFLPKNSTNHPHGDMLEENGFERNDICPAPELTDRIDAAIATAREFARNEMCSECCCHAVTIRITCQDAIDDPGEMARYENWEQQERGRVPTCGTEELVICNE